MPGKRVGKRNMLIFLSANSEQQYFDKADIEAHAAVQKMDDALKAQTRQIANAKETIKRAEKARAKRGETGATEAPTKFWRVW